MNFIEALTLVKSNPEEYLMYPKGSTDHAGSADHAYLIENGHIKQIPSLKGSIMYLTTNVNELLGEWVVIDIDSNEINP